LQVLDNKGKDKFAIRAGILPGKKQLCTLAIKAGKQYVPV
jgi:hypothetical protein